MFNFKQFLEFKNNFSIDTFGPNQKLQGVINHIRKELVELEQKPDDLEEWIDVMLLAFDGAYRSGATPDQVISMLQYKQDKNERRSWPNWREVPDDQAIEHLK